MNLTKSILLAVLFTLSFLNKSISQSLEQFVKNEGAETLARLAHPTGTYKQGFYKMENDGVIIEVHYTDGVKTRVKLTQAKGWFTGVEVLHDSDFFPPFLAVELIKNVLLELSKEMDEGQAYRIQSSYEKWLDKRLYEFSGKDITLLVMTLGWADY